MTNSSKIHQKEYRTQSSLLHLRRVCPEMAVQKKIPLKNNYFLQESCMIKYFIANSSEKIVN